MQVRLVNDPFRIGAVSFLPFRMLVLDYADARHA